MDSFRISRLSTADVNALRALNAVFGEAFGEIENYTGAAPADTYLAGLLAKEHIVVLVAAIDEQLVGGLVAYELDKLERQRRELYIYDLAVSSRYRRRGIATALIEELRQIAQRRGVWVIYVQADYGDDPAVALYEKLGVRENVMHFDIRWSPRHRLGLPRSGQGVWRLEGSSSTSRSPSIVLLTRMSVRASRTDRQSDRSRP